MSTEEIRDKLYEIEEISSPQERYGKLHQLLAKLKDLGDDELEFDVRGSLMRAMYYLYHDPAEEMAHFAWLLQYEEKHPGWYTTQRVLWYYKWVAAKLTTYPQASKERIMGVLDDMAKRYELRNYGMRPVYSETKTAHIIMGNPELAKEYHQKEMDAETTSLDDCYACQLNGNVTYFQMLGEYDEALEQAEPLLNREYTCGHVPNTTYPKVVRAYLAKGDWQTAEKYGDEGIKELEKDYTYVSSFITYMRLYACLGRFDEAKTIFENILDKVLEKNRPLDRLGFFTAAEIFMELLSFKGQDEFVLPERQKALMADVGVKGSSTRDYKKYFGSKAREIAQQFDKRNENNHYMERYKASWKLVETAPVILDTSDS